MQGRWKIWSKEEVLWTRVLGGLVVLTLLSNLWIRAESPEKYQWRKESAPPLQGFSSHRGEGSLTGKFGADFTLTGIDGRSYTLSVVAKEKKAVLLNFFSTSCGPCMEELPVLQKFQEAYGSQGLMIFSISEESIERLKNFAEEKGYTLMFLNDKGGDTSRKYDVFGIPRSFLLDSSLKIHLDLHGYGPTHQQEMEEAIQSLLKGEAEKKSPEEKRDEKGMLEKKSLLSSRGGQVSA